MISMANYLAEVGFAVDALIPTIWGERKRLSGLMSEIARLTKETEHGYSQADFIQANAEDADDLMMGVGRHWETYFGADKDRFYAEKDRENLEDLITLHQFSVASLCGSLLQHAKQGISLVHGGLANCPNGRMIGSLSLKSVIWQARNQAIHWEDGKPHTPVQLCFNTLAAEQGSHFADYTGRNMAYEVVELLGWTDAIKFNDDMKQIG